MIITTVTTDSGAILPLGRQGEHGVRQVWFDLAYLIENFGEGTAMLVYQRNKDLAPYIVSATQTGNRFEWTIDETDTAYEGFGKAEIRWTVDGALAKTVIYKTSVLKSLTGDTVIPDPYESWYDRMIEYIDQRSISPDQIDEAVESYLNEHPVEAPVDSVNGKTGAVVLDAGDVGALAMTDLQTAVNTALATAKASGEFDGADGAKGDKGDKGDPGEKGDKGDTGSTGPQGPKGDTGETGPQGPKGDKGDTGETGATGAAGYTPVKGTDYWTAQDKADIVQDVLDSQKITDMQDDIDGKISKPSSPATGAFLVWNGSAWTAHTLATWQGGAF